MWWDERSTAACNVSQPGETRSAHTQHAVQQIADADIAVQTTPANRGGPASTCGRLTVTVDLEDDYVRGLVLAGLHRRPEWHVVRIDGEGEEVCQAAQESFLHWGEYERIDWARVHEGKQHASSYCVRKGLIRKAHLAHNLKKWAAKHPNGLLAKAVPETLILEVDHPDYFEEALSDCFEVRDMVPGSQKWIAKPSITNQAVGICIFNRVEQLQAAVESAEDLREWVLQRYIERPLLINKRKFHLRAYALCIGSMAAYVFDEILALFAGVPYADAALTDLSAHLTNTCHFVAHGQLQNGDMSEDDIVKLLSELPLVLAADQGMPLADAQARVQQLNTRVQAVIGECLEAVSSELTFFTLPNCFELFGFDLLVDEDWQVWLLEANAEPDLKQTGSRLRPLIAGLIEGTLELVVDPLAGPQGSPSTTKAADLMGSDILDVHKAASVSGSSQCTGNMCVQQDSRHAKAAANGCQTVDRIGHWVKVFEKSEGGRTGGSSGIRMS
ncbi:hypothetical protein WJX72_010743 [[Myrmecia] bisecta]|uniref:Tubulin-tyrosine ligase n=1 Tax=[Myrmecia] bisecta TaxID=41462 RepID=A0AAW1Q6G9_9CHLO